jgi:GPH family glycoside/pentoside/hexuronide:cation symporter
VIETSDDTRAQPASIGSVAKMDAGTAVGGTKRSTVPPLTLGIKVLYGTGSVAFGVHMAALGSILLLFFNQVIGMPAQWVGAALMIAMISDAICDPLIGEWSDHTRSRWGRRHPFMYASAIPLAIAFYCLWHPPHGWSNHAMFVYLLATLIAVRLMLSLYEIPSSALGPELTSDYDQRTSLMSFRFLFGTLGGAGMAVLAFQVFLRKDATHPLGLLNRAGYGQLSIVAALAMVASILVSSFGTHSFIKGLVHEPRRTETWAQKWRELKLTLGNRSFVALMIAGLVAGIGAGVTGGLELYINNYFWELTPLQLSYFPMVSIVAAFAGVALAPAISKWLGKKRAMIGLFAVSATVGMIPIPSRLLGWMPPNHSTALLEILLVFAMVSTMLGIMGYVIVTSMMADVVEDIAVTSGQRSEGLLFAANGLLQKCITGVGTFFAGMLLTMVHFPQGAQQGLVDPAILRHLVVIYVPLTAGCSAIAISVLLFYRIDRGVHQHNLEQLRDAAALADVGDLDSDAEILPVKRAI